MKRLMPAIVLAAILLVTSAPGLTQVAEKDEHVNCSTPVRACSVDVTWTHSDGFIIRDSMSKNKRLSDPDETYNVDHTVAYYSKPPATIALDDPALVKWATLHLYGLREEYAETGETQSIDYASGGLFYSEACDIHDSPRDHAVTHTFSVLGGIDPGWRQHGLLKDGSTYVETHHHKDGTATTRYRIAEHGVWEPVASTPDKTRCDDVNFPFGILKTNPLMPPKVGAPGK